MANTYKTIAFSNTATGTKETVYVATAATTIVKQVVVTCPAATPTVQLWFVPKTGGAVLIEKTTLTAGRGTTMLLDVLPMIPGDQIQMDTTDITAAATISILENVEAVNGQSIDVLTDVDITGIANGDVLAWNDATGQLEPATAGGGAVDEVNGQTGTVVLDAGDIGRGASTVDADLTALETDVATIQGWTTDNVPEGTTNVYYTAQRVLDLLASGDVATLNIDNTATITGGVDGTLDVAYNNGVTLQLGQEVYIYAKATETITNGQLVMFAGSQGNHVLCALADAGATGFAPELVMGVATQDIATNGYGFITWFGKVRGLDTSTLTGGDLLYMDPATPGALTTTKPAPPNHIILVAAVLYSHATQGTIIVRPTHEPDTDEVPEGTTNLYHTNARVDARTIGAMDTTLLADRVLELDGNTFDVQTGGVSVFKLGQTTDITSVVTIRDATASGGRLWLYEATTNGNNYVELRAPNALGANVSFTLPAADGTNGQVMATDGTGGLSFVDQPAPPPQFFEVVADAGTSITLSASHAGQYLKCTAPYNVTVTLPANTFAVGDEVLIEQNGIGQITVEPDTGVTLNNSASNTAKTAEQYAVVGIKCTATNTFTLTGERELA